MNPLTLAQSSLDSNVTLAESAVAESTAAQTAFADAEAALRKVQYAENPDPDREASAQEAVNAARARRARAILDERLAKRSLDVALSMVEAMKPHAAVLAEYGKALEDVAHADAAVGELVAEFKGRLAKAVREVRALVEVADTSVRKLPAAVRFGYVPHAHAAAPVAGGLDPDDARLLARVAQATTLTDIAGNAARTSPGAVSSSTPWARAGAR